MSRVSHTLFSLRRGLIVSCQAEGDDPFNRPDLLGLFARAAQMGGAVAIRAQGKKNIEAISQFVTLPIIGLTKGRHADGTVLITPDFKDVESIIQAGADIVALDATDRLRPNGFSGTEFVSEVKQRWDLPVIADISTAEEGLAALDAGADAVATTLSGYTSAGAYCNDRQPDWRLLMSLAKATSRPVIMEGRVWSPLQARRAIALGAFAVVVGTAITRPRVITQAFVDAITA